MKVQVRKSLGLLFLILFVLSAVNLVEASSRFTLSTPITVGQFPSGVAYDSGKGEIFVANLGDGTVSVISDSTHTVVATIPVGQYPRGLAYDSAKGEIFVANSGNNTVSVISDETNTVVATVTVGEQPQGLAYDSAKGEVFVANSNYNNAMGTSIVCTVSVISDETNVVVATINVGSGPLGVAYDSGKNEIFVSNGLSSSISVISDSDNTVVATMDMGGSAVQGLAYDSGKGEIFVANGNAASVSVISDQTNSVLKEIALGDYGGNPSSLTYNSAKGEIYASAGHLYVISDSTNAVVDEISPGVDGAVYDLGKNEIFGANYEGKTVSVIIDTGLAFPTTSPVSSTSTPNPSIGLTSPSPTAATSNGPVSGSLYWIIVVVIVLVVILALVLFLRSKRNPKGANQDLPPPPPIQSSQEPPQISTPSSTQATFVSLQTTTAASVQPIEQEESELHGWKAEKLREVIETFKMKGALSPETALTVKELGLSRMFVRAMEKRRGQTRFLVELNGKYYFDQTAFEESEKRA
jgi:YVTN family beta-propeller protein